MKQDLSNLNPEELAKAERIAYLVAAFIREDITQSEQEELDAWVSASEENVLLFEDLTDEKNLADMQAKIKEINTAKALERVNEKIAAKQVVRKPKLRIILPYIIAACIAGVIISFLLINRPSKHEPAVEVVVVNDIQPGGNKALLTLANGSTIILDTTRPGEFATEGNTKIVKDDSGKLSYRLSGNIQPTEISYNTLRTPRGGQYQLILPDGSHVWLNAQSSIKYPVAFTGKERIVELRGEGYFEVAKDAAKPFHVKIKGADIRVLGTHFNVNAYEDENKIKATLLEGSVKIITENNSALLVPGESAEWDTTSDKINLLKDINADDVVGWKKGMFSFHHEDINEIMRQIARWYDVDIEYNGKVKNHFNATIDRNVSVSRLLKLLEGTGDVHFDIKDKTIIVNR